MTTTVYGIANCDTVKRARAWLAEQRIDAVFHDFKKAGVPAELDAWLAAFGWELLLNRKGTTWRKLDACASRCRRRRRDRRVPSCWPSQASSSGR